MLADKENRPYLAASSYSNSAPLIWSFWHGLRQTEVNLMTDAAPSKCAEMLRQGEVSVALTPVIEYQRISETLIIPDACVGSKDQVRSVILVTKGDELKTAKSVALDFSSRTSVALTQIIFREFYDHQPEWIPHRPVIDEMLAKHDAALLIGDPALNLDREKFRVFDIVELWRGFTGCGFVFAFWLARQEAIEKVRKIDFARARDEGLTKVEEIMDFYSSEVSLARADFRRYLLENINYTLEEEMLSGLKLYYQLAHKNALIPDLKSLNFL
ncbi:MAG: menaquinone biosynthesis protein [Pyrinomonadaceae bacterium]